MSNKKISFDQKTAIFKKCIAAAKSANQVLGWPFDNRGGV